MLGPLALVTVLLVALSLPLPFVNRLIANQISGQLASKMACAGVSGKLKITFTGAPLPQLLRRKLDHVEISTSNLTTGQIKNAQVHATIQDIGYSNGTIQVGSVDASIAMGFTGLPAEQDGNPVKYGYGPGGVLKVDTQRKGDPAQGTLLAKLELRGNSILTIPKSLKIMGHSVPAGKAISQVGGTHVTKLPKLPAGMAYKSIEVRKQGLAVGLGGATIASFSQFPSNVGGHNVTYKGVNGLLGITPQVSIPLIGTINMTIFAKPTLQNGKMTMVLKSVDVLGSNRSFNSDLIAQAILTQIDQNQLSQKLPALPKGVAYKSVGVTPAGLRIGVGGTTVQPFSSLPHKVDGVTTMYADQNGLLAATATGGVNKKPTNVTVFIKPRIIGNSLDMTPYQVRLFGTNFPAKVFLAGSKNQNTKIPLQALPSGLAYRGMQVMPTGLRISIGGKNVMLSTKQLGGSPASCS